MIITVDFETYYDKAFSLSKMTTEEYVRHDDFEVIGVAVKVDDGETEWYSGPTNKVKSWLGKFKWEESLVLAHNTAFDGAIMSWIFGIKPKGWLDTMCMARAYHGVDQSASLASLAERYGVGKKGDEVVAALGKHRADFTEEELERYGSYCRNDVDLTYAIFNLMMKGFPQKELKVIDTTLRMFIHPVLELDLSLLEQHLEDVKVRKEKLLEAAAANKDDLMSNPKFAELLKQLGVEPPTKISARTGKEAWAFAKTDEDFKALQDHGDVRVQTLVAARLGNKTTLEETRTQRFIDIAGRGKLPVPIKYYAAHTGRWGGDDKVNMQNLPRTSPLKRAIIAPEGHVVIDSDSSQIEARTLAWLAGQNDLVEAFDRGEDVYKIMASSIYGKPIDEIVKAERFVGKMTILGAGYGMGAMKFRAQLKNFGVVLSEEECMRIIRVYRETYPMIPRLWQQANEALKAILGDRTAPIGREGVLLVEGTKGIRLPNGLYIKYPNLRWMETQENGRPKFVYDSKRGRAVVPNYIYGGKAVENVCQALARIAIGEQMLLIAKKHRVVMTVHDAIACVVPTAKADEAQKFVEAAMRMRPKWAPDLPLDCESGVGQSYGDC